MSPLRFRFRAFFKRHHKLIPVIGTVIVFFTFVIREELGDSWKATAAAIDHAQELYENRVETQAIQKTVDEEQRTLSEIDLKLEGSQPSILSTGVGELILKDTGQTLAETESLLDRLEDAADKRKELAHFKQELQNGLRQGSRLTAEISYRKPDDDIGNPAWVYTPRKPKSEMDAFLDEPMHNTVASHVQYYRVCARDLQDDVISLNQQVLQLAGQVRKTNKKRSDYASIIAFGFFVLGSTLGILGKIYGVEKELSADE